MSAALQCLSHLDAFANYFLTGEHKKDNTSDKPIQERLAEATAKLMTSLHTNDAPVTNKGFWEVCRRYVADEANPWGCSLARFCDFEQQDCDDFLKSMVSVLHDDLKRGRDPANEQAEIRSLYPRRSWFHAQAANLGGEGGLIEQAKNANNEQLEACLQWMKYLKEHGSSYVHDLFLMQYCLKKECATCGWRNTSWEPSIGLNITVNAPTTMYAVFQSKFKERKREEMTCPKCAGGEIYEVSDLWCLPPLLVVMFQRTRTVPDPTRDPPYRSWKVDHLLECPTESIDLSSYVKMAQGTEIYDLVAVANHIGSDSERGHYVANCRVGSNENKPAHELPWYSFDDMQPCSRLLEPTDPVVTKGTCAFILKRRTHSSRMSIKRQSVSKPYNFPCPAPDVRDSVLRNLLAGCHSQSFTSADFDDDDPP
eukprot:gnl/TRDRNA2_/TRDRNA2_161021_c2_seq2.p1 gnl/TRDRNA2_/TRDRNA2_161021_c2~~gnl/TRDRNA2_/TRDRNA2_161021_c2_seq2.p1  ORF type:complete len:432 (+),score=46.41 gnl/TRDRNA2_/TRDRNA2_161021_c2_seq2:26-1297(+)